MFSKFFTASKELNFFSILTLIAGLEMSDAWPILTKIIGFFPEATSGTIMSVILGVVAVASWILRAFYTDSKIEFDKEKVATESEKAVVSELTEIVKNGSDITALLAAAKALEEEKELKALQAQMARLKELEAAQAGK